MFLTLSMSYEKAKALFVDRGEGFQVCSGYGFGMKYLTFSIKAWAFFVLS